MKRLIPNLLIDEEKAIKHKKFKYYKYLGDPFNIVKISVKVTNYFIIAIMHIY